MASHKTRVAFIEHLIGQYPTREREECVAFARQLLRLARKYQRMAESESAGPPRCMSPRETVAWEEQLARNHARLSEKIREHCAAWPLPVTLVPLLPGCSTMAVLFPDARPCWVPA